MSNTRNKFSLEVRARAVRSDIWAGSTATLHKHPPVEAGKRYVDLAGGAAALLKKVRAAFDGGDYRWVAEIVNHLVFADPCNEEARNLQADALEQMGYQAESGPWRGFYLTGAMELRAPRAPSDVPRPGGAGTIRALPVDDLVLKEKSVSDLMETGELAIDGNDQALRDLVDLLDDFDFWFEIVMP